MAEWQAIATPALPPTIEDAVNALSEAVTQLQSVVDTIKTPLQTVLQILSNDINPALSLLQAIITEARSVLEQFADSQLAYLLLHPWTPMAGSVGEVNPYLLELPSRRFLEILEESLNDKGDLSRPTGSGVLFTLAIGANAPNEFVAGLRTLGGLLDLQEILTLANRVEAVEALSEPQVNSGGYTPLPPNWKSSGRLHNLIPPLGNLILQADAMLESFDTTTHGAQAALITLEATINQKLSLLQEVNETLGKMQQALQQQWASIYLLEHTGSFSGAFSGSTGYPDFLYNASVSLAGQTADLAPLKLLLQGNH